MVQASEHHELDDLAGFGRFNWPWNGTLPYRWFDDTP